MKTPWYKRAAIWCVLTGAMIVGACILIWRKIRGVVSPSTFPAGMHREKRGQNLQDKVDTIEKEIDEVINEIEPIDPESSISDTDRQLAKSRERRRIAALWPRAGGAGRDNDDDRSN